MPFMMIVRLVGDGVGRTDLYKRLGEVNILLELTQHFENTILISYGYRIKNHFPVRPYSIIATRRSKILNIIRHKIVRIQIGAVTNSMIVLRNIFILTSLYIIFYTNFYKIYIQHYRKFS